MEKARLQLLFTPIPPLPLRRTAPIRQRTSNGRSFPRSASFTKSFSVRSFSATRWIAISSIRVCIWSRSSMNSMRNLRAATMRKQRRSSPRSSAWRAASSRRASSAALTLSADLPKRSTSLRRCTALFTTKERTLRRILPISPAIYGRTLP